METYNLMTAYEAELFQAVHTLDRDQFGKAVEILTRAYCEDRQIFVFGNGGSAGTANHFVCDFGKNAVKGNKRRFRVLSLSSSAEIITALGNDIAFEEIFRQQLINLMCPGDIGVAISASGNSPNVIKACEYLREQSGKLIVLAGFTGGRIAPLADAALVTDLDSYERIEDLHLIILHMIVCYFKDNQQMLG